MDHDRPIEKLLRRYAKKRLDEAGVPLELHPATRRLLQGEVARQIPKPEAGRKNDFTEWFGALQRRWVYATAAMSVLLIAGVMLVMQSNKPQLDAKLDELDLAKNKAGPAGAIGKDVALKEREVDMARRPPTPPPASASVVERSPNQPTRAESTQLDRYGIKRELPGTPPLSADTKRLRLLDEESARTSPSPAPSGAAQITLAGKATEEKAAQAGVALEALASTARADKLSSQRRATPTATLAGGSQPPEAANSGRAQPSLHAESSDERGKKVAPLASAAARTSEFRSLAPITQDSSVESDQAPAFSQSFANRLPTLRAEKAIKEKPVPPVLANFKVEQSGDRLRVIDSDGSTYFGEINPAPAAFADVKEQQNSAFKADAAPATIQKSAQNYSYRVAGTNRTLNQQIVFSWNFVELTNALVQSRTKAAGGVLNQENAGVGQQFPALLRNSAINGRAQINAASEIEINALPLTP